MAPTCMTLAAQVMMDANGLMKVTHMMALGGGRGDAADVHFSAPSAQVRCKEGRKEGLHLFQPPRANQMEYQPSGGSSQSRQSMTK